MKVCLDYRDVAYSPKIGITRIDGCAGIDSHDPRTGSKCDLGKPTSSTPHIENPLIPKLLGPPRGCLPEPFG
jgi:hypothetical protein